jgi:transcriptional regulator
MRQKDDLYKNPVQNTDWLQLWKEAIEKSDIEGGIKTTSQNISYLNSLRAMTPEEIKAEGQIEPKRSASYKSPFTPEYYELKDKIRRTASEFYRDRYTFSKMSIYLVKDHEILAESESDAVKIYELTVATQPDP